ncbi:MAG: 4-(cytidine 5'-diphospho)-2-C-methyl-D-erythritol kinase [Alphaproteobacteria bacterium]|nr:4-(cytidine 5'-diphospho)-2-C-methyl-D-erythritol kinase [Alphaproteobacteria bacterium]
MRSLTVFAPAKINLYLHVTQRLPNGYHALDSLVAFADIGDQITLEPSKTFAFHIEGPFAGAFQGRDIETAPHSTNLAVKAAWALARLTAEPLDVSMTLTKNLPLGAGIGGGSADAAAVLWALHQWWSLPPAANYLPDLTKNLGADVPVCYESRPRRMRGIGDILDDIPPLPEVPVVLVHPGKACSTPSVFGSFKGPFAPVEPVPASFETAESFVSFLHHRRNDLEGAAKNIVPEIENVLKAIDAQKGVMLARMSGSGSTCFGLFEDEKTAHSAAQSIKEHNPDWWIKSGWLGRTERY